MILSWWVPGVLHMKVRRESDCKLNLDSSENITQAHCDDVHIACSLLQANRCRQWVTMSRTHLIGLRACRPIFPKRLYTVCLKTVVPTAADSWRDWSDTVLCLLLLAVTAKYYFSIRDCNWGATCTVTSTDISIILESLPKPKDGTLGNSNFLRYFHLSMATFQAADNSTT